MEVDTRGETENPITKKNLVQQLGLGVPQQMYGDDDERIDLDEPRGQV
jgi:hypothetical protein